MLTTQSYLIAMLYTGRSARGFGVDPKSCSPRCLGHRVSCSALGGVLLTPAFGAEAATLAPALIVVIFNALFGVRRLR